MKANSDSEVTCRHHWLLGQPEAGVVRASCRNCGAVRDYPAVLDDLDPGIQPESQNSLTGKAVAAGGARPPSVALPEDQET